MGKYTASTGKANKQNSSIAKPVSKSGVYVAKSNNTGKTYVGRSSDIPKRIEQHNSGQGAKWTSKTNDWKVVKVYKGNDNATENAITKGVMRNEGIANVRGGSYTKSYYPKSEFRAIKKANGFTNNGIKKELLMVLP
uniref:GIY-YIG domain-containing protein n=1 Tax=Chromulina nebulosa TaxID=96789 RepID=A0A7S0ST22_9STRA|mmetsp:Transcript_3211/g.2862  ORF Transcript_3211/g.2862 Transcript_3211/m.2862 type:complete len:137 (+) Transcript_3211:13-423(+)